MKRDAKVGGIRKRMNKLVARSNGYEHDKVGSEETDGGMKPIE